MTNNDPILGIALYQFNDWKELLKISDDRNNLETTWDEWNDNLHSYEELLRKQKIPFKEILVNLEDLKVFCTNRSLIIN